jgi:hypothetical protein
MAYVMRGVDGVSFEKCAADLNFMKRTKSWNKAWTDLLTKGFIEPSVPGGAKTTADHRLTELGKAQASTPEYEEFIKDKSFVAATNQDHQDRIKKRLVNDQVRQRSVEIFDLFLEHGELTRKELCGIMGVRSGTHTFSFGLKQLKDKELVGGKGSQKLRLSDKAFLNPAVDRPDHVSDQETIDALLGNSKYADEYKEGGDKKPKQKKVKGKKIKEEPEDVNLDAEDDNKDNAKESVKEEGGEEEQEDEPGEIPSLVKVEM